MMQNRQEKKKVKLRTGLSLLLLVLFAALPSGCDLDYGTVGGTAEGLGSYAYTDDPAAIARVIGSWSGVWYSHYGNRKLDGYRIGKWKDRHALIPQAKLARLFPDIDLDNPRLLNYRGMSYDAANDFPRSADYPNGLDDAYFVLYDDTVFETEPGDGGNGGWGDDFRMRYFGVVKAVNTFYSDKAGAVIIQYLDGGFPNWDPDFPGPPPLSYFGIYYRVLAPDIIQMANAVELGDLAAGKKYYTETATLEEAIAKNTVENEGEFIAWGVVIPQDREQ
jgi:hypothetical protein